MEEVISDIDCHKLLAFYRGPFSELFLGPQTNASERVIEIAEGISHAFGKFFNEVSNAGNVSKNP